MAVGAHDVGENVGIAGIALGGDGAITRPARLDDIGMDRDDSEPGLDQRVDEKAAKPLDGNRRCAGRAVAAQAGNEIGKAVAVMGDGKVVEDLAGRVDDTNGMARSAPIETDENGHGCTLFELEYGARCRELPQGARQSALWTRLGRNVRGASSCSPSGAPGHRNAAGLMRALMGQATLAVVTVARDPRPTSL